ncbi:mcrBC 5-methylcytosine restriction system component [Desulfovibrio psychrotolerans]|uniref:McrBC 5-methylcytosine restriction system component n=2 Tax=Desulfovibrio psychrotolerans TaxID=415242 RepID=A0A7J0BQL8_9BACT|nr:mcrBC 5-methylcytosine restriction system component [Desulfovibrio psychrotolerans]
MHRHRLTVFESTPFPTGSISHAAQKELVELVSQAVYVHGADEAIDNEDKYIFTPLRGNRLVSWRYVGVVQTSDGTVIEILPKIFKELDIENATTIQQEKARNLLLQMLQKAGLISYRQSASAKLQTGDYSLLEVFIHSFLREAQELTRRGLRKDYVSTEMNLTTLRGRIHFPRHVRKNPTTSHRHYCRYDEYCADCIENRLLTTAVQKAYRISKDSQNKKLASQLLPLMDDISTIPFPEKRHFDQCRNDRHMRYYADALRTARYILLSPPIPKTGGEATTAILFNMANLFEKTVERCLSEDSAVSNLAPQKSLPWFKKLGRPRPDYVFHDGGTPIVADAKWKLPQEGKPNNADQYQLFSYMQVLDTCAAYIIYPQIGAYGLLSSMQFQFDLRGKALTLHIIPFSLETFLLCR